MAWTRPVSTNASVDTRDREAVVLLFAEPAGLEGVADQTGNQRGGQVENCEGISQGQSQMLKSAPAAEVLTVMRGWYARLREELPPVTAARLAAGFHRGAMSYVMAGQAQLCRQALHPGRRELLKGRSFLVTSPR